MQIGQFWLNWRPRAGALAGHGEAGEARLLGCSAGAPERSDLMSVCGGCVGGWRCLLLFAEGAEGVDAAGVVGREDAGEQGGEAGEDESRGELRW